MKRLFFLLLICFSHSSYAQQYFVEDLLEVAQKNALNIRAAEDLVLSQKDLAMQEKYWSNPSFGFSLEKENSGFNIGQVVPFYSKLQKKYDIQNWDSSIFATQKQNLELLVKAEVFALVYRYFGVKTKIDLFKKRLDRLASVNRYLDGIVLTSPTKKSQAFIVKDRINLITKDVIVLENELVQIWNRINIFTLLDSRPEILVRWIALQGLIKKDDLKALALENNLTLKEQKQLVERLKSELSFAKIEQMPDVGFSIAKSAAGTSNSASGAYVFGVSASVPLFNTNQYKISGLNLKVKAQESSYRFYYNQVEKLIESDLNKYDALFSIAEIFPVSRIDVAIKRLSSANFDFKKGILDFITYIELDSQEYEVINTVIETQVDIASVYADLMVKSGNFVLPRYE